MSWKELRRSELTAAESPVETETLGLTVGRVSVPTAATPDRSALCTAIERLDTELTVVRVPTERPQLGPLLSLGLPERLILHVDTLVYWSLQTREDSVPTMDEIRVTADPSPELVGPLVERIFAGYQNHYAANPLLPQDRVAVAYSDWAVGHVRARRPVRGLEIDKDLVALATLSSEPDHIEILLAGVIPEHQKRGIYGQLLAAIERLAADTGTGLVVISTQIHNYAVQRAWARYGFLPMAAFATFHVMKRSVIPPYDQC